MSAKFQGLGRAWLLIPSCVSVLLLTAVAGSRDYVIGAGDSVQIEVLGEKEFSGLFRVTTDGKIDYPYIREVSVAGKTVEDLSKELTDLLRSGYLNNPQVNVEVKEFRSQQVVVLGAVNKPGKFALQQETRLLDLISLAGGITPQGGKRILVLRESKEQAPDSEAQGVGSPQTTGNFETSTEATIATTPPNPDGQKNDPLVIDYYRLTQEGDFAQNILVKDGDIINVPKANEIFVLGNVARPGPVKYEGNLTILQAVTLAGGPTATASPKSTYILRRDKLGQERRIQVRLDRVLENKEKNVELQADDVIVVPESFF